jgi:hypothetical protein
LAKITNKLASISITLLKAKKDLESLLLTIRIWKKNGVDGTGVVPFAILPLEEKIQKSIRDLEEIIKIASKI